METTQQLVEQYIPWANKLAHRKKRGLPKFIELDEVRSAAYLGLVEAAERFDPEMGVEFTTFSYRRIWGAIHDYLRERGWGSSGGEYQQVASLDAPPAEGGEGRLGDAVAASPEGRVEECFEAVTAGLPEQAKLVLRHYFIDEYSMREVGDMFGVSESRVSQLIKQYKSQIRDGAAREYFAHMAA